MKGDESLLLNMKSVIMDQNFDDVERVPNSKITIFKECCDNIWEYLHNHLQSYEASPLALTHFTPHQSIESCHPISIVSADHEDDTSNKTKKHQRASIQRIQPGHHFFKQQRQHSKQVVQNPACHDHWWYISC